MSKIVSSTFKTHLADEVTTNCTCWQLTRRDGIVFRFTDHDQDIVYLGNTYEAAFGYNRSAVQTSHDFSVDNLVMTGFYDGSRVTVEDLRAGLFDFADVRIFMLNWADLTMGDIKIKRGYLGDVTSTPSGIFETQLNGLNQILTNNVGDLFTPTCRVDLGSSGFRKCNKNLTDMTVTGAVSSLYNTRQFFSTINGGVPAFAVDNWYTLGVLTWTSGLNIGRNIEIKGWSQANAGILLYLPMQEPVQVGDTFSMYPGCNKHVAHCRDKFNNIVNMQAEPYVPGSDYLIQSASTQQ